MNVLFVTEDHSLRNGGVTTVVSQLADELVRHGEDIKPHIFATQAQSVPQREQVTIDVLPPALIGWGWCWSPQLKRKLAEVITRYKVDLVHVHGVWMAAQWYGMAAARQYHLPLVISPHGMLEPWFWSPSISSPKRLKKQVYLRWLLASALPEHAILHAITPMEKANLAKFFPNNEIVVIPNAITINDTEPAPEINIQKKIVFLGRIHPKKGLDLLIRAFHQAKLPQPWQLLIAGPTESPSYQSRLEALVESLQLTARVHFTGPLYGEQKAAMLRSAWVMVTPSYSEVIGMVNLEAAQNHLPSITTYETGLLDWEDGGGLLVHPDVNQLRQALTLTAGWRQDERITRGQSSFKLVRDQYSWQAVLPAWQKLYTRAVSQSKGTA